LSYIQLPNSKAKRADLLRWLQYQQLAKERRDNWRFWWTLALSAVAAFAAVIAAIEGWPRGIE
jgi:hypothetical protein